MALAKFRRVYGKHGGGNLVYTMGVPDEAPEELVILLDEETDEPIQSGNIQDS